MNTKMKLRGHKSDLRGPSGPEQNTHTHTHTQACEKLTYLLSKLGHFD